MIFYGVFISYTKSDKHSINNVTNPFNLKTKQLCKDTELNKTYKYFYENIGQY